MVDYSDFPEELSDGLLRDKIREDELKLQSIMQYLESRGLMKSLAILQAESQLDYNPTCLQVGGLLDEAIDTYASRVHSLGLCSSEEKSISEPGVCATELLSRIDAIHGESNPTCVAWHPSDSTFLATGGVDKKVIVRLLSGSTSVSVGEISMPSPVLSIAWTQQVDGSCVIAAGCMGGELLQINASKPSDLRIVSSCKPHGNCRVSKVTFSDTGTFLASAGKDSGVHIFRFDGSTYKHEKSATQRCERDVSAVCWIRDDTLVIAETDNPILKIFQIGISHTSFIGSICMNLSIKDPISPYSTLEMCWSARHRLLLSCTSRNSALLFDVPDTFSATILPTKVFYGMSNGIYDYPCCDFSLDGSHVYISSDREVIVFESKTGHIAFKLLAGVGKPVRGLSCSKDRDLLATVSFDKSLTIFH